MLKDYHYSKLNLLEHKSGHDLLFDDTFGHYAVNWGERRRLIIMMDIPRPDLPQPWRLVELCCTPINK